MAISRFAAWKSTVTPLTARWIIGTDKWLIDPQTFAIVGAQNPNFFDPDARFTPVDITQAEHDAPPALLLADLDAIFRLSEYPLTWYRSNSKKLIPLGGDFVAGNGITITYDVVSDTTTISANPVTSLKGGFGFSCGGLLKAAEILGFGICPGDRVFTNDDPLTKVLAEGPAT